MLEAMLAVIVGLIGTQTIVIKWLMTRSDRLIENRDKMMHEALRHLSEAVDRFKEFEKEEDAVHSLITERLNGLLVAQERIADRLDKLCTQKAR